MNRAQPAAPAPPRRRPFRSLATLAALALLLIVLLAARERWVSARELVLARGTGWLALAPLLASLCCTPLSRLRWLGGRAWPGWRRPLGMASAWLALLHASLAFGTMPSGSAALVLSWPHLRAGFAALVLLLLLLATSFPALVRRLRLTLWRELHRLVYVAALLVLQHLLLSPFAPRALTLCLFAAAGLLGLLRLL